MANFRSNVWLNDIDPSIVSLWTSVRNQPNELIAMVEDYQPTPEQAAADFYRFREEDGDPTLSDVERGFRKMVLHRTSFSGLGFKAGGPIGGKNQGTAKFNATCRWNPRSIVTEIRKLNRVLGKFANFRFTNLDFEDCIRAADPNCFIYADPPYVEQGPALYKHAMDDADHVRLRDALQRTEAAWVLSYDDHPLVRELYSSWADIREVFLKYTMATQKGGERASVGEVIIVPRQKTSVGSIGFSTVGEVQATCQAVE